jgi:hypothetical protein
VSGYTEIESIQKDDMVSLSKVEAQKAKRVVGLLKKYPSSEVVCGEIVLKGVEAIETNPSDRVTIEQTVLQAITTYMSLIRA